MNTNSFFRKCKDLEKRSVMMKLPEEEKECLLAWKSFDTEYRIKDIAPDAVWDFVIDRPEPPSDPREIIGWGKTKKERKFPYYTKEFKKNMEERMDEKHSLHSTFLKFINQEWDRRRNGLFFYNGDKLEYVTGRYYMFLQYWEIPVVVNNRSVRSNPEFRDNLLMVSYASQLSRLDRKSLGLLYYSMRRGGKTVWGISDGYWDATENRESVFSIQSKTHDDAKIVFKKLVDSWQALPAYWKPMHSGETDAKNSISFRERRKVTKEGDRAEYRDVLKSTIYNVPANEAAQDGTRVTFQLVDEVGKCKNGLDPNERHNINKECLVQGNLKLGNAYVTSTIEDFEKYAAEGAQTLWKRSDPMERQPDGMTDSGLYRLFLPAYFSLQGEDADGVPFVDEWGYTDIPRAKKHIISMYAAKTGQDLLSYRRKYPLTIDDSFALTPSSNNYSKERLLAQKKHNADVVPSPWVRGNFVWAGGQRDTKVEWRPDKDGRWVMGWMPKEQDRNKYEWRGNQRFPTRSFAKSGADPFAHSHVQGKGSKAAVATVINGYPLDRRMDNSVVCIYLHRTQYTEEMYEDVIKQCVFYSSEILPENNVYSLIDHMRQRGYDGYVMKNPLEKDARKRAQPKKGISFSGTENRESMMSMTQTFIYDYIGYNQRTEKYGFCPDEVLDDWTGFEPDKWTRYDMSVAVGAAIIAMYAVPVFKKNEDTMGISDWYHSPR